MVTSKTEKHISSEVTRDQSVHKTSTKINLQNEAVAKIKRASQKTTNTLALRQAYQQTVAMHQGAGRLIRNPRAYMHLAVLGGAMAIVFGSNLVSAATRTQAVSQLGTANGLVATVDPFTSSQVAVSVAKSANLAVDTSALVKLSNVADQSTLAGDANALAKQEVISIAQSIRRAPIAHKVEKGDTIDSLAKNYNITTDTIKWANGVNADADLQAGKELKILPVSGVSHTIQAGETVEMIAAKFRGDVAAVKEFNDLDVKSLQPGTELVIPDGSPANASIAAAANSAVRRSRFSGADNSYYGSRAGGSFANTYTRGQCTWYVASRRQVPNNWGNAYTWLFRARAAGYATGTVPRAGAIGWERGNHVVYVEGVNANGTVNISEMNWGGRPGVVHYRTTPASQFQYIY